MKGNRKFRQMRDDDSGTVISIEVMMFVGFAVVLAGIVGPTVIIFGNQMKDTGDKVNTALNTTATALVVATGLMKNVTDYMQNFHFNQGGDNNSTTPFVELEFNYTTQRWDFWYCVGHEQLWVKLTPDIKTQQNYTLDIIITGKGTVTKQPMLLSYKPGTPVLLNATQNVGWCFIHWAQDFNSTENPATIIMNSNKVVYAVFQFINT